MERKCFVPTPTPLGRFSSHELLFLGDLLLTSALGVQGWARNLPIFRR